VLQVLWEKARENVRLHADLQSMKEAEAASAAAAEVEYLQKWDMLVTAPLRCQAGGLFDGVQQAIRGLD
jgi:hypothetical protein